jgi:hypothetical protein
MDYNRTLPERMSAIPITRATGKTPKSDTIFIPLPVELWRKTAFDVPCSCDVCKGDGSYGYWDTLAISARPDRDAAFEYTHVVHYPELHPEHVRRAKAAEDEAREQTDIAVWREGWRKQGEEDCRSGRASRVEELRGKAAVIPYSEGWKSAI